MLSPSEITRYRRDGFIHLAAAIPLALALRCRDLLWDQLDEDPSEPSSWRRPVVRIGSQTHPAFGEAAQSRRWIESIHDVAGPFADPTPWMGGTFAIRFPCEGEPGDDGWHIEGSYLGPDGWW